MAHADKEKDMKMSFHRNEQDPRKTIFPFLYYGNEPTILFYSLIQKRPSYLRNRTSSRLLLRNVVDTDAEALYRYHTTVAAGQVGKTTVAYTAVNKAACLSPLNFGCGRIFYRLETPTTAS
jgi:hypothetical protein